MTEEKMGVAYVKSNGEISRIDLYNGFSPSDGTVIGDQTVHYITDDNGIDFGTFINSHIWNNGWVNVGQKPNGNYYWGGDSWVIDSDKLMELIRNQRDNRLYQSDWTQLPDAPLTDAQKNEWQTYRQSLRDVPINNSNVTSLEEVVWPAAPTL